MSNVVQHDARTTAVLRYRQGTALAVLILLVCLGATTWAWRITRKHAFDRTRAVFQQEVDRTSSAVLSRLELYEDGLYGTRSLFDANDFVTRAMFQRYVSHLDLSERYPGLQGIGYVERVDPKELREHIQLIRDEGFPQYTIFPPGQRPVYTSVIYLEPFNWRNQRAFGYDMFSEPIRRHAMEHARDTGRTGLTAKLKLVQETEVDVQPGFLMYLPIYRKGALTDTIEQRRAALIGYVYSPFRTQAFMRDISREAEPLTEFEVYSGASTDAADLMYRTSEQAEPRHSVSHIESVQFGGQSWTLRFLSTDQFDRLVAENTNPFVLPAGIAISFLLFGITYSIAQTEKRALKLADTITARLRESERSILSMNEKLTEALYRSEKLAITGRLVATVAHEINNPLEALTNLIYMLKVTTPNDPAWQTFVSQAEDQVAVLTNISRQTLAPYRFAPFPVTTNISELLEDVLTMFRPRLMSSKIRVERDYPSSVEVTIYSSELRQVFTNLVANALDAMSPGGVLTFSVREMPEIISIAISDTGTGISEERLKTIFEPFFTTKGDKGTGVGLWVVSTILEKLGGSIEVKSSTDPKTHGTTFTVIVPNRRKTQPEGADVTRTSPGKVLNSSHD